MDWRAWSCALLSLCAACHDDMTSQSNDLGMGDFAVADQSVARSWVKENTPVTGSTLYGVWASGPTDIYAVGFDGVILHSNGDGIWQQQQSGTIASFADVYGSGPNEIYAAAVDRCLDAECARDGGHVLGGLFRSTGDGTWTDVTPSSIVVASSVWISRPGEGYVAGADFTGNLLLRLHADGSFTTEVLPTPGAGIGRVRGSSAGDVYALGGFGLIYHSTGDGNWSLQAATDMGAALFPDQIPAVWAVSPTDVYVVGENSLVIHSTGKNDWTKQKVPQLSAIPTGVWASGPTDVYVVTGGDFFATGDIIHSDGSGTWTVERQGAPPALFSIWGNGPDDIYAVGADGTILHYK
jgi:hypothetical protein